MLHGPTSRYGATTPAQVPVQLRQVFPGASFVGCANIRVTGITANSRECQPGMMFAAIPGTHVDGHDFADQRSIDGQQAAGQPEGADQGRVAHRANRRMS